MMTFEQIEAALSALRPTSTEVLATLVKGLDMAFGKCSFDATLLPELANAIECGPSEVVNIASLISMLIVQRHDCAKTIIEHLTGSKKVQGRLGALYCLPPALADDFLKTIIGRLISDKSKKVREMAIDWISRNKKTQLLPLLRVALDDEIDATIKAYIEKEIKLLSVGYHVCRDAGSIFVTVAGADGTYGGFFNEPDRAKLSDDEIAKLFLKGSRR